MEAEYSIPLLSFERLKPADVVILAVAHDNSRKRPITDYLPLMHGKTVLVDVKGMLDRTDVSVLGGRYWRM